jgi:hypothetical protein
VVSYTVYIALFAGARLLYNVSFSLLAGARVSYTIELPDDGREYGFLFPPERQDMS